MPGALRAPGGVQSGRWRGHRFTGQGRRHGLHALYFVALSAMHTGSPFAQLNHRLREKAKAGRAIAVAVARKLPTIANAVIGDGKPFRPAWKTQLPGGRAHARRAGRTGRRA